ncbi:MAG: glycoside hydrolase family 99-like domain-containing protein [Bradymonadales bacterium]|nr:glycoside hydrolase family 99-like domain-containing protein [Bradymonadales bacterium]
MTERSEENPQRVVGSVEGEPGRRPVLAYYYPAHHEVAGLNWNEWKLVRNARPWFEGHRQPVEPAWGYLVDSRPETFLRQARAALEAGIEGFIIDSPWRPGREAMFERMHREALLPGLEALGAEFRFAIMWVPVWPREHLPASMEEPELAEPERYFPFTGDDLTAMLGHFLDPYLLHPSCFCVNGRPFFVLFHTYRLLDQLGREGTIKALAAMREQACRAGLVGLFLVGILNQATDAQMLTGLGLDAVTSLIWWPEWRGPWIQDYLELGQARIAQWALVQERLDVPYLPSIAAGWDATPRGGPDWDGVTPRFPWSPIVVGNSPQAVSEMLAAGLDFLDRNGVDRNLPVMLASFNEWSEGHFLEPSNLWGDGHLKAIGQLLKNRV